MYSQAKDDPDLYKSGYRVSHEWNFTGLSLEYTGGCIKVEMDFLRVMSGNEQGVE
jgi:hypothetical protein